MVGRYNVGTVYLEDIIFVARLRSATLIQEAKKSKFLIYPSRSFGARNCDILGKLTIPRDSDLLPTCSAGSKMDRAVSLEMFMSSAKSSDSYPKAEN